MQQVISIKERDSHLLARERLHDSAGRSLILAGTRALGAVELRDVSNGIELRALGLVGYLPLTSEIVLNVQPKFPIANLWVMLEAAEERYERILPILRSYAHEQAVAPTLLLARSFCFHLKNILALGVARVYHQKEVDGYYRPKLNFGRTLSRYLAKGDHVMVSSDVFDFSNDARANRLLKSACLAFIAIIPNSADWKQDRLYLMDALNALTNLRAQPMGYGDMPAVAAVPSWLRSAYEGALATYSLYLGHSKIGFSFTGDGQRLPSFLFSLDQIFENFVRNEFSVALSKTKFRVTDGNKSENQSPLFKDNKTFPIKPDLIIKHGRKIVALGEVKYKPKVKEGDRYQLISHVTATESPLGLWISPTLNENSSLDFVGTLPTGAKFFHYKLSLHGDIRSSAKSMVDSVLALVS